MRWLRRLFHKSRADKLLDLELRFHIERHVEENVAAGMPLEEARRRAQLEFGGLERVKEEVRDTRWETRLDNVLRDVRYALRSLRKSPAFTIVAVLTLALGIGANTAIFTVVYAVLLKPLPYTDANRLFRVFQQETQGEKGATGLSYANFADVRVQNQVFSEMAASQRHALTLTGRGTPSIVDTSVVTPELFSLLGEQPLRGRVFYSEDGKPGAPPVVILSESLWRGVFGADPNVVGSSATLDKRAFTIVGVMPAKFRFPLDAESDRIWIPLVHDPLFGNWMARRGGHWLQVIARLKPGVTMAQAQADLDAINARLVKDFPAQNKGWALGMASLQQMIVGDVRTALLVLLAAVGLVLLIACANIANLLLARATSRAREIAVRTALGATRSRLMAQLLCETALLGLLGGLAGVFLARWGVQGLSAFLPESLPRVNVIRVDNFVLGFALLLSALTSGIFGLAPAWFAAHTDLQSNLRDGGGRTSQGGSRRRGRKFLAAGEVALAMVLLVVAGLLLRSFARLLSVSPGFDVQHALRADISLPQYQYSTPQQWSAFADELLARIQAQPGLQNSAMVVPAPITDGRVNLGFDIAGSPSLTAAETRSADYVSISPDYFRVMSIPLLAGRIFNQRDSLSSPKVTIISQALARLYFPNQDPLGKRLIFGFPPDPGVAREIVGIAGDIRDTALGEAPGPMMYVPFAQGPFWGGTLIVKSTLSASSVAAAIRGEVRQIDKDLPVANVAEVPDLIGATVAEPRFRTFLLGLFAAMALTLAAVGIFGVISYSVSCRTNEMGIRVALGASRGSILLMVLRETMTLTLGGLLIGVPCALAASHLVGSLLFGVSPNDPATLTLVALLLVAVASSAGYIPARRATRIDPLIALRQD
jgi:putative ABC transport system permease protein